MGGDLHVVIQEHVVVGFDLCKGAVISFGKAIVLVKLDNAERGVMGMKERNGVVGGAIVGNNYFGIASSVGGDRREKLLQHVPAVPVEYYDCCVGHEVLCKMLVALVLVWEVSTGLGIRGMSAGRWRFHRLCDQSQYCGAALMVAVRSCT